MNNSTHQHRQESAGSSCARKDWGLLGKSWMWFIWVSLQQRLPVTSWAAQARVSTREFFSDGTFGITFGALCPRLGFLIERCCPTYLSQVDSHQGGHEARKYGMDGGDWGNGICWAWRRGNLEGFYFCLLLSNGKAYRNQRQTLLRGGQSQDDS